MKHPWIPMYWGDYLTDTWHLTQGQHGAYLLLLGSYFTTGQPLPSNEKHLLSICRAQSKQEIENVRFVLNSFFVLDHESGGVYRNGRADEELAKRSEISTKRSLAGRLGGSSKSEANAKQKPTQSQPQLQPQIQKRESSPPHRYSQSDFDERDIRKIGEAWKRVNLKLRANIGGQEWSDDQIIRFIAAETGLTVKRILELDKKQMEIPAKGATA